MATGGELVSTHMPKKSWVKNWLHECQLLASVMLLYLWVVLYINYHLKSEVSVVGYVQPVTQHFESRTVRKAPLQSTHTERNGYTPQLY